MYYLILFLGLLFFGGAVAIFIFMVVDKEFSFGRLFKGISTLLLGTLMLFVTLPSLKYIVLKDYDVVKGECTIEVDSVGRSSEANFHMRHTDEIFSFLDEMPDLDAYGRAIPYYCEVTVTKDHLFEVSYKIYDLESRELLETSE